VIVEVALADEAATEALGAALARALPDEAGGLLLSLRGELGTGKTTLVRAMLRELGHVGAVPSPTYTLVEPYELGKNIIYHVDLYRIADAGELEFLGWSELRDGLVVVEWPERAAELTAAADVAVELDYDGRGRRARLVGNSIRGAAWLAAAELSDTSSVASK
jgi:tRNA threonylcarbamoyladenosine biosynthesis protein TsaE